MSGLPGLKIGPLDPDVTSEFGRVAAGSTAKTLLRAHARMHPVELTRELARPMDVARTKSLDKDEVVAYLKKLRLENGDPVLPEHAEFLGAAVRGTPDRPQVLTFQYSTESGRVGKWFVAYDRDQLPDSAEAGDELAQVEEMRERGVVFGLTGAEAEVQRRSASRLRRQNEALRARIEGRSTVEIDGDEQYADVRPDVAIVSELQDTRRENEELKQRLAVTTAALEEAAQRELQAEGAAAARRAAPAATRHEAAEPVEGYDDLNAEDAKKLLRSDDLSEEDRERILEYERSHSNRRTVIQAGEAARSQE